MAEALITAMGTLKAVMDSQIKDLAEIKVGSRKVGPVVAGRLHGILNGTY